MMVDDRTGDDDGHGGRWRRATDQKCTTGCGKKHEEEEGHCCLDHHHPPRQPKANARPTQQRLVVAPAHHGCWWYKRRIHAINPASRGSVRPWRLDQGQAQARQGRPGGPHPTGGYERRALARKVLVHELFLDVLRPCPV